MEIASQTGVSSRAIWESLSGQLLDSRFELLTFMHSDRDGAWFRARDTEVFADAFVFVESEEEPGALDNLNRFREAAFLSHPHLVRVLGAGRVMFNELSLIYLATETAESDLAEALAVRSLSVEEAGILLRQIASSVAYLRSENLTSCAVRAGAIWKVDGQWKLGDYTQLRVPGPYPAQQTRKLLLMPAFECPPEAHEGLVSPAWDVWSIAAVLRKVFPTTGRAQFIPAPFNTIIRNASDPDPANRPSVEELVDELLAYRSLEIEKPKEPLPEPVPEPVTAPEPVESITETTAETVAPRNSVPAANWQVPPFRPASASTPAPRSRVPAIASVILAAAAAAILAASFFPSRSPAKSDVKSRSSVPTSGSGAPAADSSTSGTTALEQKGRSPFGDEEQAGQPAPVNTQTEISSLLSRWAEAKRQRDVNEEMRCYAPLVDRFYGQRGVSVDQLRREEQNVFSRIGTVQQFDISNIKFGRINRDWAVVSFDKSWRFDGRSRFAGSSREELVLRPVRGQWKISSQREVKVYWAKKQS